MSLELAAKIYEALKDASESVGWRVLGFAEGLQGGAKCTK